MMFLLVTTLILFTSCENQVTDGKGIVVSVRNCYQGEFGVRKYHVKVKIDKDDLFYHLYTNQVYTVGDTIEIKY